MICEPLRHPMRSPLRHPINGEGYSPVPPIWTPADLFANGEAGAWYDPSDLTTMFQDAAGTVPVTADGQPVGMIRDKSGNAKRATQAATASCPVYRTDGTLHWLEPDGIDDFMVTPEIAWSSDAASSVCGAYKGSEGRCLFEVSANLNNNPGSFWQFSGDSTRRWSATARGNDGASAGQSAYNDFQSPDTAVLTATHSISGSLSRLRRNGVYGTDGTGAKGTGNFGTYPTYLFRRGGTTLPYSGRLYQMLFINRLLTEDEIAKVEQYVAAKTGVAL